MKLHAKSTEDMGRVQTVFLDGALRIMGDNRPQHTKSRNAPHEHGAQCGGRTVRSPAAVTIPDQ